MNTRIGSALVLATALAAACGGTTSPLPGPADGGGSADSGGGSDAGSGTCSPACPMGRACCNGACVNTDNDPNNCGGCGIACGGTTPYCNGSCQRLPCTVSGGTCPGGGTCCGSECCTGTQICCKTEGPIEGPPTCITPTTSPPTCPQGCAPLCVSDREAKRDVLPIDARALLEAISRMPVTSWSYRTDPSRTRHVGPMAQDFHDAFGLGATDRAYDPIDAHGVAFASIKALYDEVKAQRARIEKLEKENAELRARGPCSGVTR